MVPSSPSVFESLGWVEWPPLSDVDAGKVVLRCHDGDVSVTTIEISSHEKKQWFAVRSQGIGVYALCGVHVKSELG